MQPGAKCTNCSITLQNKYTECCIVFQGLIYHFISIDYQYQEINCQHSKESYLRNNTLKSLKHGYDWSTDAGSDIWTGEKIIHNLTIMLISIVSRDI